MKDEPRPGPREERTLDEALAALPRELDPPRDLWRDIEAQLEPRRPTGRQPRWPTLMALAASLGVVAVAGVLAFQHWALPGGPQAPAVVANGTPEPWLPAEFLAAEAAYRQVRAERVSALEARLDALPAETRAVVERSLATIAEAQAELRAALAEAPTDPVLQGLLLTVYSQEMAILGQFDEATRVAGDGSIET